MSQVFESGMDGKVCIKPKEYSVFTTKIRECIKEPDDDCTFA